ncbi:pentapeptide repeat-containing protein [Pontibacter toksunensis]|uniref:Pentapeptide repeat-containing protein n=1 Tax=Pontibacter toksunensis TaxID=1332631 RepID=A0ABW6BS51_9BACT
MKETHHRDKTFDKISYANKAVSGREFEACTFTNCDFSGSNFSGNDFIDCRFEGCNLSNMRIDHTGLKQVGFYNCKVMGVDFSSCQEFLFSVSFSNCILDFVSFFRRKIRKTTFDGCSIKEANFTQTDLSGSCFSDCDLSRTIFDQTILEKVDLRTASNYSIDPETNKIRKARFSLTGLPGLLEKHAIVVD